MTAKNPFFIPTKALIDFVIANRQPAEAIPATLAAPIIEKVADKLKFVFDYDYINFKRRWRMKPRSHLLSLYISEFADAARVECFLRHYKLASSLIIKAIDNTVAQYQQIQRHYHQDMAQIERTFNKSFGGISDIVMTSNDTLQKGKTSAFVRFDSGDTLVYKPRKGGLDIAYNRFLTILNGELPALDLKTIKVVDADTHCWAEYVENHDCATLSDIETYYCQCGALMALAFFLGGEDLHFKNVIAAGKHPVIIDLEHLLKHQPAQSFSLSDTGLLPQIAQCLNPVAQPDASGFGANGIQRTHHHIWTWQQVDSPEITLVKSDDILVADGNQPRFQNRQVLPEGYVPQILRGFRLVSDWFVHSKPRLLASGQQNPLHLFKNKTIRIGIRSAINYKTILENSLTPPAMLEPHYRERRLLIDLQEFPTTIEMESSQKSEVMKVEADAIGKMDIPYFTANTSGYFLNESNQRVLEDFFEMTPYRAMLRHLSMVDKATIEAQEKQICLAFAATASVV